MHIEMEEIVCFNEKYLINWINLYMPHLFSFMCPNWLHDPVSTIDSQAAKKAVCIMIGRLADLHLQLSK